MVHVEISPVLESFASNAVKTETSDGSAAQVYIRVLVTIVGDNTYACD